MSNVLELLQKKYPNIKGLTESNIRKSSRKIVDPTEAAREKVLAKIKENIDGFKALNDGKEWPTHPLKKWTRTEPPKRERKPKSYARWFALDEKTDTYEIVVKYGAKNIAGIFGADDDGADITVLSGIEKNYLLPTLFELEEIVTNGSVDELLVAARSAATVRRSKAII